MTNQNRIISVSLALALAVVSGCKPSTPTPDNSAQPPATSVAVPSEGPQVASGQTVIELASSDPKIKTQVGVKEEGVLVATGKKGVLAFGPYQQVAAGKYLVSVQGSTSTPFLLDITSEAGKNVHASRQFTAQENEQTLATLPFELAGPVQQLEVRLVVPEGSDVRLVGYKVVAQ